MPETVASGETQQRTPSAMFRALISAAVEPGLAHDASEEVRDRAGENILAAVQASEERLRVQTEARFVQMDARFDVLTEMIQSTQREIQSTQREISTLRWMIGIGFTLLALFIALAKLIGD